MKFLMMQLGQVGLNPNVRNGQTADHRLFVIVDLPAVEEDIEVLGVTNVGFIVEKDGRYYMVVDTLQCHGAVLASGIFFMKDDSTGVVQSYSYDNAFLADKDPECQLGVCQTVLIPLPELKAASPMLNGDGIDTRMSDTELMNRLQGAYVITDDQGSLDYARIAELIGR